jgi:hypothetical protein
MKLSNRFIKWGFHFHCLTVVANHLVQSFIRFAGASYTRYVNIRSGTVGDRRGSVGRHLNGKEC